MTFSNVGVFILVNDTFCFYEFKGVVHKTTIASLVSVEQISAVKQHLFRKIFELFVGQEGKTFESSNG